MHDYELWYIKSSSTNWQAGQKFTLQDAYHLFSSLETGYQTKQFTKKGVWVTYNSWALDLTPMFLFYSLQDMHKKVDRTQTKQKIESLILVISLSYFISSFIYAWEKRRAGSIHLLSFSLPPIKLYFHLYAAKVNIQKVH